MIVLISVIAFILGILFRNIVTYFYNLNKTIIQAREIVKKEQERLKFKEKYDFSDSFDENITEETDKN